MTPQELLKLKTALPTMDERTKRKTLELLQQYYERSRVETARTSFLAFIKEVYPGYMVGPHHKKLAALVEAVVEGKEKRITVSIAPRMGKSEMISYLAPASFLGRYPNKKIIVASHTADLAVNIGRRVRNLVDSNAYKRIFPGVSLQQDSKSASRWGTNQGGEFHALGVGGAVAGKGADLFIVDDAHSEQEAKQNRPEVFAAAYEWYQTGPLQRLMPGGAIVIVGCMTGDTRVLLPDGTEKRMDQIQVGDEVATYENGTLAVSRVLNYQSSGVDDVFTIRTRSGRLLRANARHPFLVEREGVQEWVRLKNLRPGMALVSTRVAQDLPRQKPNPDCADPVQLKPHTIASTLMRRITQWGITVNGWAKLVSMKVVQNLSGSKGVARSIITRTSGLKGIGSLQPCLSPCAGDVSSIDTGSRRKITREYFWNRVVDALFVKSARPLRTLVPTGTANSVSITATTLEKSEDSCATTAISQSGTEKLPVPYVAPLTTYSITTDVIESVELTGKEEVFDVQIERTECFIANGVVSHNTRWNKADLIGKVIDHSIKNEDADKWTVVEFPAIIEKKDGTQESLWPEFWPLEEILAKKAGLDPRYFQAQYMQNPVAEEGALIKREWWRMWEPEEPPACEFIIMSLDAAQEATNRADYNSLTTWGVFYNEEEKKYQVILLNAINKRMEFPELKQLVLDEYNDWHPDSLMIEKKSNGAALCQELSRMGIIINEFVPGKGQDKVSRVNAVADIFYSGLVWAPDRRWAREVVEQCAEFPSGEFDDQVDSTTLALMRFRQGGFLRVNLDEPEPARQNRYRRGGYYSVL